MIIQRSQFGALGWWIWAISCCLQHRQWSRPQSFATGKNCVNIIPCAAIIFFMARDKPDILDESQHRACKAMSRLADLLALWRSPPAYGMGMIQSVQLPWIFARRSLRSEADVGWDGSLLLERTLQIFNGCLREEGRGRSSRFASDMLGSC